MAGKSPWGGNGGSDDGGGPGSGGSAPDGDGPAKGGAPKGPRNPWLPGSGSGMGGGSGSQNGGKANGGRAVPPRSKIFSETVIVAPVAAVSAGPVAASVCRKGPAGKAGFRLASA